MKFSFPFCCNEFFIYYRFIKGFMTRNEPANEENAWVCFWNFVTKLGHVIPYHTIPYRTVPYRTVPYRTVPYRTVPYRTVPYRTVPYHTIPYYLHFFLQFICCTRKWYLGELGRNLPKNVLDKSWLAPPPAVKEVRTVSKLSTPTL